MQPKKLEHYKYFQPIAWTICLSFAGFVMMLALQLQATVRDVEQNALALEQRMESIETAVGID